MRKTWTCLAIVAMLLTPAAAATAAPPNPILGSWEATDVDGSHNWLRVGGNFHVVYQEDGLTLCEAVFGQFVGGSAIGDAEFDGTELTFTATIYCNLSGGRAAAGEVDFVFVYDAGDDTLTQQLPAPFSTVEYHRSGS